MGDELLEAATSFDEATEFNYKLTLGNNKKQLQISVISSNKSEFSHIIGLDHLSDIWQFTSNNTKVKEQIFRDIISRKISLDLICQSSKLLNIGALNFNNIVELPICI